MNGRWIDPLLLEEQLVYIVKRDALHPWDSLVRGSLDQVERDKIKKALLEYCGQDTLALVRLLERLRRVSTDRHT